MLQLDQYPRTVEASLKVIGGCRSAGMFKVNQLATSCHSIAEYEDNFVKTFINGSHEIAEASAAKLRSDSDEAQRSTAEHSHV